MTPGGDPRPLFLLALPRSGSTLVQRLLGASDGIATTAEPWVLLPLLEGFLSTNHHTYARYDHETARVAIDEFADRLPGGRAEMEAVLRDAVVELYRRARRDDEPWFLDKTPRYAAYLPSLLRLFPDAGYVVLLRDPREVASSIIRTWGRGHWNLFLYLIDLERGLREIDRFLQGAPDSIVIRYEDVVRDPQKVAAELSEALGVDVPGTLLPPDAPELRGSMGDRASAGRRAVVPTGPTASWEAEFQGAVRRWWLRRYLRRLSADTRVVALEASVPWRAERFHLVDRWSDLVLVPLTVTWDRLDALVGHRLEATVRRRLSRSVRRHGRR